MARAPFEAFTSFSVTLRDSLPARITFADSADCATTPSALRAARSMSVAFMPSSESMRTSATSARVSDVKPRFGRRRCSGICPPSKPTLWKPPERARWPLWPRPAVLPQPEATPRPTRWRDCLEPAAGLSEFSFMICSLSSGLDPDQVVDLVDHAAHGGRVDQFAHLVDAF